MNNSIFSFFTTKNARWGVPLFFLLFLVIGLNIYKDYGMCWDERTQQKDNAELNYKYVTTGDSTIFHSKERYHGPALDLVIIGGEKALKLEDTRDIYLFRHLVYFLVFFAGSIFFFLFSRKVLRNSWLALLPVLLMILSPRIFAESFYNPKDVPFLAFFLIAVYLQYIFLERPGIVRALLFALATGFMIDIRISGIVVPVLTAFLYLLRTLWLKQGRAYARPGYWLLLLLYLVFTAGFVVLFWPVLWGDPVFRFTEAYKEMSHYPWTDFVLYWGQQIPAPELPWHYAPVWIFISTPPVYILLFLMGVVFLLLRFFRRPIAFATLQPGILLTAFYFFFPLFAVIFLHSVIYDGWRHLYLTYPFLLLTGVWGLKELWYAFPGSRIVKTVVSGLLVIQLGVVLFFMLRYHPNQHLYFSELMRQDAETMRKWELDYWGPGFRSGLEYILAHDNRSRIDVAVDNFPGEENIDILPVADRQRLCLEENPENADYFIANFRFRWDYYSYPEFYVLNIRGMKPLVVYKMH